MTHADYSRAVFPAALLAAAGLASGCGGGKGGAVAAPVEPPTGSGWTAGVFASSDDFAAQCLNPRSGIDAFTGLPFPDVQGTTASENNWLRSWSHELYLWYDEIVDRNPASYSTADYFDLLKTFATTPSGAAKDKFHFTLSTSQWREFSQSGTSAGYGAQWIVLSDEPPREVAVAYVEPGSPAATAPASLARGARVLAIDGIDLVNATDSVSLALLNAGLSPAQPGESHSFTVRDLDASSTRTFTMAAATVTSDPVQNVTTLDTPTGRIGYLLFNDHIATAEQELADAVATLDAARIDDLVLDIRYNGGGYLVIASQLAYMIAGQVPTAGRTFELQQFNDKHPVTNPVTGETLAPVPFVDTTLGFSAPAGQALPTLDLPRVFVLTGPNTCSASESIINGLQGIGVGVIQIGATTCGKPYGFYPSDNCGTTYFSIQFRGVNDEGFGDYTDGFSPVDTPAPAGATLTGCAVADDFDHALGDPAERRLAAALAYRDGAGCPAAAAMTSRGFSQTSGLTELARDAMNDGRLIRPPWREIRTLGP